MSAYSSVRCASFCAVAAILLAAVLPSCCVTSSKNCSDTQFWCADEKCLPLASRCDGVFDCADHSDEANCNTICKLATEFQCRTSARCISKTWQCDGFNDCADGTDESGCSSNVQRHLPLSDNYPLNPFYLTPPPVNAISLSPASTAADYNPTPSPWLADTTTTATPGAAACSFVFTNIMGDISINETVYRCLTSSRKVTWQISVPGFNDRQVRYRLVFLKCQLQYLDLLKVYDGLTDEDNLLGSFTGTMCPSRLFSSRGALFIELLLESAHNRPYLSVQYMLMGIPDDITTTLPTQVSFPTLHLTYPESSQCTFQISDMIGEISSKSISGHVSQTGFCSWMLHVPRSEGQSVVYALTFDRFQLSPNSLFYVYDGPDMASRILWTNSDYNSVSTSIRSTQNNVLVYYSPDRQNWVGGMEVFTIRFYATVTCDSFYQPCGYGELRCVQKTNLCDGIWHCPLLGGDEWGCSAACPGNFSCGSTCFSKEERCTGNPVCANGMDEQSCDDVRCSADKGLYLCRNGNCIYEAQRCNKLNDCFDGSDEEGCAGIISPRVILAAASSSLICVLVLVIALGCVCKVYRTRVRHLHRGLPRHETPLSRQLAEMLRARAPPPSYHEAMLTSRPYSATDLPALHPTSHERRSSGLINLGYQDNQVDERQHSERGLARNTRGGGHQHPHTQSSSHRHLSVSQESDSASMLEANQATVAASRRERDVRRSQPPNYATSLGHSEMVNLQMAASFPAAVREEDAWLGDFNAVEDTGSSSCNVDFDGESLIQMEVMSSQVRQHFLASPSSVPTDATQVSRQAEAGPEHQDHKDVIPARTRLMSLRTEVLDLQEGLDEDDKLSDDEEDDDVNVIDINDSDSDCILAEDEDDAEDDNSSTDSDTACILVQE